MVGCVEEKGWGRSFVRNEIWEDIMGGEGEGGYHRSICKNDT